MGDIFSSALLLQTAPDRIAVGWGPFERSSGPREGRASFYAPDFFLDDREPWWIPARCEELDASSLRERLPDLRPAKVHWQPPEEDAFLQGVEQLLKRIGAGELSKGVPVGFASGELAGPVSDLPISLLRALARPAPREWLYGMWNEVAGLIGRTPEMFFRCERGRIETMALAGTRGDGGEELLCDPKQRREHALVIHHINSALADWGRIYNDATEVVRIGRLSHLCTPISVEGRRRPDVAELVAALHPTPALGTSPREAGRVWLREQDRGIGRGRFGAPFGVALPDGRIFCVVAIRNAMWSGHRVRIGAGCGVVAQSVAAQEWKECLLKQKAVKEMLAL